MYNLFLVVMVFRRITQIILFLILSQDSISGQFGKIEIIFDEQLLRSNIRQLILPLREEIKRFYTSTVWNQEFVDLEIPLNIQIIFEGATQKGSSQTFLAQA